MSSKELFNAVVNILEPHMNDREDRRALVQNALIGCNVLNQIEWDGNAHTFMVHLVQTLIKFGQCSPGRPAVVMLLEELKSNIGVDKVGQIDALIGAYTQGSDQTQAVPGSQQINPVPPHINQSSDGGSNLTSTGDGNTIALRDVNITNNYSNNPTTIQQLRSDPDKVARVLSDQAYVEKGVRWRPNTDFDKKIELFSEAIRLNPLNPEAYYYRGEAYSMKLDFDRAMNDWTEAIILNPQYAEAYASRGSIYTLEHEYALAFSDHNNAIRIEPKNPLFHCYLVQKQVTSVE